MRAAGLVLGTLAALAALTPSLLPRPAVFQGALAALSFLLGSLLGTLVHRGVRRLVEQRRARVSGPGPTAVPPASARSAASRLWRAVTGDAALTPDALAAVRAEIASYPYAEETD